MAGNMILFSTLSDPNDNHENVNGDTVLQDGPLADPEAENIDESAAVHHDEGGVGGVESGADTGAAAEPQDEGGLEGVDTEADAGKEPPQGHDLEHIDMESSENVVEETGETAVEANQNKEKENTIDDREDGDVETHAPKKSGHSKKNRNVKSVITTLKNKLENIQENNGGKPNYLLIFEDNFSDVARTGPKTKTNRKMIVTAAGDLKEAFKSNSVGYNPEKMIVMKKGKNLEQDFSFIDEYIKEKTEVVPSGSSTPMNRDKSLIDLLKMLTKGTTKKDSRKKRKNTK